MEKTDTPTIKGIYIKSHVDAVKRAKGDGGLTLLAQKFGKPIDFKNSDAISIRDEVHLLECVTEILSPAPLTKEQLSFQAGRQHFTDFLTTPYAKIIFPYFQNQFKVVMMQIHNIASHIFQGVDFTSIALGDTAVKVIMKNNEYPIEHFRGLFQSWMEYSGLHGTVEQAQVGQIYEYTMRWQ